MCSKQQGYYQNNIDIELVNRSDGWYFIVAGYTSPIGYANILEAKDQADVYLLLNTNENNS